MNILAIQPAEISEYSSLSGDHSNYFPGRLISYVDLLRMNWKNDKVNAIDELLSNAIGWFCSTTLRDHDLNCLSRFGNSILRYYPGHGIFFVKFCSERDICFPFIWQSDLPDDFFIQEDINQGGSGSLAYWPWEKFLSVLTAGPFVFSRFPLNPWWVIWGRQVFLYFWKIVFSLTTSLASSY